MIKKAFIFILSLLLLSVVIHPVFAVRDSDNDNNPSAQQKMQAREVLSGTKLRACEARQDAIKKRSTQLVSLVTTMESKFDAIAKRIKEFYTSKVVAKGKIVKNYDALIADIQAKKDAVQTAITTAQSNSVFDCASQDPKAQMTQFRTEMIAVKSALKEYRTSIKKLIVEVHSVIGTENREGSPNPTKGENQ